LSGGSGISKKAAIQATPVIGGMPRFCDLRFYLGKTP
jgi:hypothetical protein